MCHGRLPKIKMVPMQTFGRPRRLAFGIVHNVYQTSSLRLSVLHQLLGSAWIWLKLSLLGGSHPVMQYISGWDLYIYGCYAQWIHVLHCLILPPSWCTSGTTDQGNVLLPARANKKMWTSGHWIIKAMVVSHETSLLLRTWVGASATDWYSMIYGVELFHSSDPWPVKYYSLLLP